jgi:hypothetical protein
LGAPSRMGPSDSNSCCRYLSSEADFRGSRIKCSVRVSLP